MKDLSDFVLAIAKENETKRMDGIKRSISRIIQSYLNTKLLNLQFDDTPFPHLFCFPGTECQDIVRAAKSLGFIATPENANAFSINVRKKAQGEVADNTPAQQMLKDYEEKKKEKIKCERKLAEVACKRFFEKLENKNFSTSATYEKEDSLEPSLYSITVKMSITSSNAIFFNGAIDILKKNNFYGLVINDDGDWTVFVEAQ